MGTILFCASHHGVLGFGPRGQPLSCLYEGYSWYWKTRRHHLHGDVRIDWHGYWLLAPCTTHRSGASVCRGRTMSTHDLLWTPALWTHMSASRHQYQESMPRQKAKERKALCLISQVGIRRLCWHQPGDIMFGSSFPRAHGVFLIFDSATMSAPVWQLPTGWPLCKPSHFFQLLQLHLP